MDFLPCALCDIDAGMPVPGGILLERDTWCAVHLPPPRSAPRCLVLFPRRHVLRTEDLDEGERLGLLGIQADVRALLAAAFDDDTHFRQEDLMLGHLCWLAWRAGDGTDVRGRFRAYGEAEVTAWAEPLRDVAAVVRLLAHGGRLPPPAPLPGDAQRLLLTRSPLARYCSLCGNRLHTQDHRDARCRTCGKSIPP